MRFHFCFQTPHDSGHSRPTRPTQRPLIFGPALRWSGSGRVITYDFENRPVSITKGGVTTTFVYDGDGGRVQKTDGTTTTIYIGKLYVCENGSYTRMIFAGSNRIAQKEVTGGAVSYYHHDQRNAGPNIYVRWIYSWLNLISCSIFHPDIFWGS